MNPSSKSRAKARLRAAKRKYPRKVKDSTLSQSYYPNSGGLVNPLTGAGTSLDKNYGSFFNPTRLYSKSFNEILYVESWAAAKFVDIPVDDMLIRWREFTEMDNQSIERVKEAETRFGIQSKLSKSMKAGSLYGTGLFIILTKEAPPDKPLNIHRLQPGDLSNIITVDRFDVSIIGKDNNIYSKNYGLPYAYRVNLKAGGSFSVHHSRVIRFDGITPTTDNSWQSYEPDWGVASITPVITEIFQDSSVSKGVAHLVNEASIPVQKIDGFEEAISGDGDEMSIQDRMAQATALRTIYRTVFMDATDEFSREDVTFSGLPEVIDRNSKRLAAAAGITYSRFMETSAVGMNATGEGDFKNYAVKVAADQNKKLPEPLSLIDSVLEKHLGLNEKIQYRFPSLIDMSDDDKAGILLKLSQALVPLGNLGSLTEDEIRRTLSGNELIGDLDDLDDFLTDPGEVTDDFRKQLAELQAAPKVEQKTDSILQKIKNTFMRS